MKTLSTEDLQQIQGVGKAKAEVLAQALADADNQVTTAQLTEIKGVSERIAKAVIKATKEDAPKAAKKATRKRATKKTTTAKATARRTGSVSNGRIVLKAGSMRRLARSIEDVNAAEAARIRSAVSDLLDDEAVPSERFE